MDGSDYTAHMMVHLLDGSDTVNAKFLFQRAPEHVQKRSKSFNQVWSAVKALNQHAFGEAIGLLRQPFQNSQSTNPFKDVNDKLRQLLVRNLTEHTVPQLISEAYSNIEFAKVKQMLGDPANLGQMGLLASANPDN